jgi:hypothetical protein
MRMPATAVDRKKPAKSRLTYFAALQQNPTSRFLQPLFSKEMPMSVTTKENMR